MVNLRQTVTTTKSLPFELLQVLEMKVDTT